MSSFYWKHSTWPWTCLHFSPVLKPALWMRRKLAAVNSVFYMRRVTSLRRLFGSIIHWHTHCLPADQNNSFKFAGLGGTNLWGKGGRRRGGRKEEAPGNTSISNSARWNVPSIRFLLYFLLFNLLPPPPPHPLTQRLSKLPFLLPASARQSLVLFTATQMSSFRVIQIARKSGNCRERKRKKSCRLLARWLRAVYGSFTARLMVFIELQHGVRAVMGVTPFVMTSMVCHVEKPIWRTDTRPIYQPVLFSTIARKWIVCRVVYYQLQALLNKWRWICG